MTIHSCCMLLWWHFFPLGPTVRPVFYQSTAASSTAAWGQWPVMRWSSSNQKWQPVESREAQTSYGEGKSSRLGYNVAKSVTFRKCSPKFLEGRLQLNVINGYFPGRDGRMLPENTVWDACDLNVPLPPLHKCPHEYSSLPWSELKEDHHRVEVWECLRLKVHLPLNRRHKNIQHHLKHCFRDD